MQQNHKNFFRFRHTPAIFCLAIYRVIQYITVCFLRRTMKPVPWQSEFPRLLPAAVAGRKLGGIVIMFVLYIENKNCKYNEKGMDISSAAF